MQTLLPISIASFLKFKSKKIAREEREREAQEEEVSRLKKSAAEKKGWGAHARRQAGKDNDKYIRGANRDRSTKSSNAARAIEKKLEQIELTEPEKKREKLVIPLSAVDGDKGRIVLDNLFAGYPGFHIGPINLQVSFRERVGILGRNGCGKSTLLKVITGELEPIQGIVRIGSSLVIGSLMQGHEDLPRDLSMVDYLVDHRQISRQDSYHLLKKFHFCPEDFSKPIGLLSPGERARLLLVVFSAASVNVLVLDEPTNHLDIDAVQALEDVLREYEGTVVFVSHDRYFLEEVKADKLYDLNNSVLKEISHYTDYLERMID